MEQTHAASFVQLFLILFYVFQQSASQEVNGNVYTNQYQAHLAHQYYPNTLTSPARGTQYYQNSLAPSVPGPTSNYISNLGNHQGYNYITPAGTHAAYAPTVTKTHKTQTPPLAISLQADDYQNFDKTAETYFIPRTTQRKPSGLTGTAQQFYVESTSLKSKPNLIQNQNNQESVQAASSSNSLIKGNSYQEPAFDSVQQKWTPLPANNQQLSTGNTASQFLVPNSLSYRQNAGDTTNYLLNNGDGGFVRELKANRNPKTTLPAREVNEQAAVLPPTQQDSIVTSPDCQNSSPNQVKGVESVGNDNVSPVKGIESIKNDYVSPVKGAESIGNDYVSTISNALPNRDDSFKQFNIASSIKISSHPLISEPEPNPFVNQRRLQLLRSLLAEYLSLAYPQAVESGFRNLPIPEPQSRVESLSSPPSIKHTSPALDDNNNDEISQQQVQPQTSSIGDTLRQPHPIYGAPLFGSRITNLIRQGRESS